MALDRTTKTTTPTKPTQTSNDVHLNRPKGNLPSQGEDKELYLEHFGILSSHGHDVQDTRYKAVTNPEVINPLSFTDPTDRHAAILARADRIVRSDRYKGLDDHKKQVLLSRYYDKYVQPGYHSTGLPAPDKATWIAELPKLSDAGKLTKDYYFPSTSHSQAMRVEANMIQSLDSIRFGGIKLAKKEAMGLLGLSNYFGLVEDDTYDDIKTNWDKTAQDQINKISRDSTNEATFWLQTHPSKTWTEKIDNLVGENLVQLPLYEAIGATRIGLLSDLGLKIPEVGKLANLSEWLSKTPAGKFTGARLAQGADAYLGAIFQGKTPVQGMEDAASWMLTGGIFSGTALGSRALTKAAISKFAAVGGKPLVEALENQATHELNSFVIAKTSDGGEVKLVPATRETGHIETPGLRIPYNNLQEQQALVSRILANHHEIDPIHFKALNTVKVSISQEAEKRFGKPFVELTREQKLSVLQNFRELTTEAMNEIPLHNPDLAATHFDVQLKEDVAQNPKLGQRIAEAEKASGLKVSSTMLEDEAEKIQKETGIKSSQAVANKVKGSKAKLEISPAIKAAREEEPRRFAQFKIDTLAYLKNYASKFKGEASKGLAAEIRDMDEPHEFAHALQEQMGHGAIKFETDQHALLWANQFRSELPKPFQKKLIEELHELNPQETIKDWDEQSANLSEHMDMLATTGRLFSQGNVFRSTEVNNWIDKTKWQRQLEREVEEVELDRLNKTLYRHPEMKKTANMLITRLQKARRESENAGTYKWISQEIRRNRTVTDWKKVMGVK